VKKFRLPKTGISHASGALGGRNDRDRVYAPTRSRFVATRKAALDSGFAIQVIIWLLLDYPDLDLGVYIRVQPDWNSVDTKCLDRLVKLDLSLLDGEALRLELVRDI
jgi:hypothetical protein